MQLGGYVPDFLGLFDIIGRINADKSIPIALLDERPSLAINKIDQRPLLVLRGSGQTLTNKEIKDTTNVIRSLENRWILTGTTRKTISQIS